MLQYLYNGTYGDAGNGPADMPSILLDVATFSIADKYFIKPLKDKAADRFAAHCESEWQTVEFAQAIKEVYRIDHQDEALKITAIATVKRHSKDLFDEHRSYDSFDDFHKVLRSVSGFSADILAKLDISDGGEVHLGRIKKFRWRFKCPTCDSTFEVNIPLGTDIWMRCPLNHLNQDFSRWKAYRSHVD